MIITVCDIMDSRRKQHEFDHVIGLLGESERSTFPDHSSRHMFNFEDDIREGIRGTPTLEHIQNIIKLFDEKNMRDTNILVHCYAGISRSTAVSIGLLIHSGVPIAEAHETIQKSRPILWPNELILKHFDDVLGLNGELVDYDRTWKNSHRGTLVW